MIQSARSQRPAVIRDIYATETSPRRWSTTKRDEYRNSRWPWNTLEARWYYLSLAPSHASICCGARSPMPCGSRSHRPARCRVMTCCCVERGPRQLCGHCARCSRRAGHCRGCAGPVRAAPWHCPHGRDQDTGWRVIGRAAVGDGSGAGGRRACWRGARRRGDAGLLDAWGIPRARRLVLRAHSARVCGQGHVAAAGTTAHSSTCQSNEFLDDLGYCR